MKKVLSLFMVLLFAISLFACGNKESKEPTVPTPATPEQVIPETPLTPLETVVADVIRHPYEIEVAQLKQDYPYGDSFSLRREWDPFTPIAEQEDYNDLGVTIGGNRKKGNYMIAVAFDWRSEVDRPISTGETDAYIYDVPLYFDIYFRSDENKVDDYVKVSLKADYVDNYDETYYCKFYDDLYPHLEIDKTYEAVLVARMNDEVIMWTGTTFSWSQKSADKVVDYANLEYDK